MSRKQRLAALLMCVSPSVPARLPGLPKRCRCSRAGRKMPDLPGTPEMVSREEGRRIEEAAIKRRVAEGLFVKRQSGKKTGLRGMNQVLFAGCARGENRRLQGFGMVGLRAGTAPAGHLGAVKRSKKRTAPGEYYSLTLNRGREIDFLAAINGTTVLAEFCSDLFCRRFTYTIT